MTTKTFRLSEKAMERSWHVLDASAVPLGRLASEASKLLLGKHKPTYEPHLPMGDFVVVINAAEIARLLMTLVEKEYQLVITHGNGPQVGALLLQQEFSQGETPGMPLDVDRSARGTAG